MGNSSYFGVINVGNPADVVKACASFVHTDVRDYNRSSLFENINKKKIYDKHIDWCEEMFNKRVQDE